jgi:hypothetical protein
MPTKRKAKASSSGGGEDGDLFFAELSDKRRVAVRR